MNVEIGDWVMGNTDQDELIHGFIDSMNELHGTVGITVIASDNEFAIGATVEVLNNAVKKLPDSSFDNKEQLKSLIDIALLTNDEQWFMELTDKLYAIQHASNIQQADVLIKDSTNNRLRMY
jgi:hypothetical protein